MSKLYVRLNTTLCAFIEYGNTDGVEALVLARQLGVDLGDGGGVRRQTSLYDNRSESRAELLGKIEGPPKRALTRRGAVNGDQDPPPPVRRVLLPLTVRTAHIIVRGDPHGSCLSVA